MNSIYKEVKEEFDTEKEENRRSIKEEDVDENDIALSVVAVPNEGGRKRMNGSVEEIVKRYGKNSNNSLVPYQPGVKMLNDGNVLILTIADLVDLDCRGPFIRQIDMEVVDRIEKSLKREEKFNFHMKRPWTFVSSPDNISGQFLIAEGSHRYTALQKLKKKDFVTFELLFRQYFITVDIRTVSWKTYNCLLEQCGKQVFNCPPEMITEVVQIFDRFEEPSYEKQDRRYRIRLLLQFVDTLQGTNVSIKKEVSKFAIFQNILHLYEYGFMKELVGWLIEKFSDNSIHFDLPGSSRTIAQVMTLAKFDTELLKNILDSIQCPRDTNDIIKVIQIHVMMSDKAGTAKTPYQKKEADLLQENIGKHMVRLNLPNVEILYAASLEGLNLEENIAVFYNFDMKLLDILKDIPVSIICNVMDPSNVSKELFESEFMKNMHVQYNTLNFTRTVLFEKHEKDRPVSASRMRSHVILVSKKKMENFLYNPNIIDVEKLIAKLVAVTNFKSVVSFVQLLKNCNNE